MGQPYPRHNLRGNLTLQRKRQPYLGYYTIVGQACPQAEQIGNIGQNTSKFAQEQTTCSNRLNKMATK
eukprot:3623336-Amphidinium_carterae.1